MQIVDVEEASTDLPRLIERACAREEIVIALDGEPAVRLVPVHATSSQRRRGRYQQKGPERARAVRRGVLNRRATTMTVKERLHRLVDNLPDSEAAVAERVLEALSATTHGGLPAFLSNAPADDEPYTEQERAAVEEAYESIRRGEVLSDAELRRELGR